MRGKDEIAYGKHVYCRENLKTHISHHISSTASMPSLKRKMFFLAHSFWFKSIALHSRRCGFISLHKISVQNITIEFICKLVEASSVCYIYPTFNHKIIIIIIINYYTDWNFNSYNPSATDSNRHVNHAIIMKCMLITAVETKLQI